jgi:amino acid permease
VTTSAGGIQTYSYGLGFAWFLALLAGIITLVGGYLASRTAQPAPARYSPPHAQAPPPAA